jgi:hypothetical protein
MLRRTLLAVAILAVLGAGLTISQCSAAAIPTTGLAAWLDAGSITGLENGQPVGSWVDSVGGDNATAAGADAPTYHTNAINGQPALHFDGVNSKMLMPTSPMYAQTDYTVFAVFKENGARTIPGLIVSNVYNEGGHMTGMMLRTQPQNLWFGYDIFGLHTNSITFDNAQGDSNYLWEAPDNSAPPGATYVVGAYWHNDGAPPLSMSINGVSNVVTPWTNGAGSETDWATIDPGLGIGQSSTTTYPASEWGKFNGDVAELIFYNGTLSSSDRAAVESYLTNKYLAPEPGTLALVATGLAALVAYAWRKRK